MDQRGYIVLYENNNDGDLHVAASEAGRRPKSREVAQENAKNLAMKCTTDRKYYIAKLITVSENPNRTITRSVE